MSKQLSREQLAAIIAEVGLAPSAVAVIDGWLKRGDGVAVYRNEELGHPEAGHRQFVSYGSPQAQIEYDQPPEQLPDLATINWRYRLEGTYEEEVGP